MAEKEVTLWDDEETDSSHPGKTARTFGQAITAPAEGNSLISWRRGVQVSAAIIPGGESSGERGGFGDRIHLSKVQGRALCTGKRNNNRLTVCRFCSRIRIATGKTSNFKIPK